MKWYFKVLSSVKWVSLGLCITFATTNFSFAAFQARIKDIADFSGIRTNALMGYGLIVGLNGTGDQLNQSAFTKESLESMLERLGLYTRGEKLNTKNVAAVIVEANLPAFARFGNKIDITLGSMGNAKSLSGGMLLPTPLMGADGQVYAVAQGQVHVSGFEASGQSQTLNQGTPTIGRIPNGATIEREIPYELAGLSKIRLSLRNPDLTTSERIAQVINTKFKSNLARPQDPATIELTIPAAYQSNPVPFFTQIEQLEVVPDVGAIIVIDKASGTIVMGEKVRISTIAIAQGNITLRVSETPLVSQPSSFSYGQTQTASLTEISVQDGKKGGIQILQTGVSVQEVVKGLNALGLTPSDMISILQAAKAAGAIQADIKVI